MRRSAASASYTQAQRYVETASVYNNRPPIDFAGSAPAAGTPNPHRKACLVMRQTLDSDSVYADAASHGDGLTSLQWRDTKGGVDARGAIERGRAEAAADREARQATCRCRSPVRARNCARPAERRASSFTGDFYVGLGVSAHDIGRIETAAFSNVAIGDAAADAGTGRPLLVNTLETISVQSEAIGASCMSRRRPAVSRRPTGSPTPPTPCTSTTEARCTRFRPNRPARRAIRAV